MKSITIHVRVPDSSVIDYIQLLILLIMLSRQMISANHESD